MSPLHRAIEIVNGQSELARRITQWLELKGRPVRKIRQQHVYKWLNHKSGFPTVPPEYRLAIQEITDNRVSVTELSHDIYGSVGDGNSCTCQS